MPQHESASQLGSLCIVGILSCWQEQVEESVHPAHHNWNNILTALTHSVNPPEEGFLYNERHSALKQNHRHSELL